jgi:hypothetical protein
MTSADGHLTERAHQAPRRALVHLPCPWGGKGSDSHHARGFGVVIPIPIKAWCLDCGTDMRLDGVWLCGRVKRHG